jgi:ParB family chromosome partitioning protein
VESLTLIPLDLLKPSVVNVRIHVDPEAVRRLAEDIAARGLLHPLIVRPEGGGYGVVCGRMRLEAIRLLQREKPEAYQRLFARGIPCVVKELGDREALELSLAENIRQNTLTPEEVGRGIARLYEMGLSPEEIRQRLLLGLDTIHRAIRLYTRLREVVEYVAQTRAGRPPRRLEKREKRVSRTGAVEVARMAERISREQPLSVDDVVSVVTRVAAEYGLSTNEMKLAAERIERMRPKTLEEVEEAARRVAEEIKAADYRERVVLIRRALLESVEAYAAERQISFHEAVNELLEQGLHTARVPHTVAKPRAA